MQEVRKSNFDPRDIIFEHICSMPTIISSHPDEFDLRQYAKVIRDQESRPTCAAFIATSIYEILLARQGINEIFSPEFVYYNRITKPIEGMHGRDVFRIMKKIGMVPEHLYPYNTVETPKNKLYKLAKKNRLGSYAKIITVNGLKHALVSIGPCYLSLPRYNTTAKLWIRGKNDKELGSHALTVVGYTKDGFILQNSWGIKWNNNGHCLFEYKDWPIIYDCWVGIPNEKFILKSLKN